MTSDQARHMANRQPDDPGVDHFITETPATLRVIRRNAGSFFFIPTRYWAYIVAAGGCILGILTIMKVKM